MSAVQLRRSGRRRTTTTKASSNILDDVHLTEDEEWQELDEEEDDDGATQQRRTKRQKTKGSSTKKTAPKKHGGFRRRGRLSALPEMPLDILFEIMKYLDPLDILRMARTTKDLRSILMKRSALSVWKSARANISRLPDCPEGVSEPAFANFMFTTNCHVCLAPRAAYSFAARCARYCKYCVDQKVIWKPYSDPDLLSTLPGGRATSHHLMYAYEMNKPHTPIVMVWLQQDYDDLLKEYQEFPDSATKAEDFLELKKSTAHDIGEREDEYRAWLEQQETLRAMQRYAARDERRDAIMDRLIAAGFDEDIRGLATREFQQFRNHHMVKQPRPLSDRIWKNIEPVMTALMLTFRDQRRQREHAKIIARRRGLFATLLNSYEKECPFGEVVPSTADLYFLDSAIAVRQIIEESPDEEEVTLENFAEYKNQLPQICSDWKTSMIPRLLSLIQAATGEEVDESFLHLAKTVFACGLCDDSISYPQVLAHSCLQELPLFGLVDVPRRLTLHDLDTAPWNENRALTYRTWRVERASEVIKGCGFDPDTAKPEDLDAEKFWALSLTRGTSDVEVMDWRRAVKTSHIYPADRWCELSSPETVASIDDVELMFYLNSTTIVACVHCRALLLSKDLMDHVPDHKPGPVERSDFFVHRDNPTFCTFTSSISVDLGQCGFGELW